jgi:hypothetical protein
LLFGEALVERTEASKEDVAVKGHPEWIIGTDYRD